MLHFHFPQIQIRQGGGSLSENDDFAFFFIASQRMIQRKYFRAPAMVIPIKEVRLEAGVIATVNIQLKSDQSVYLPRRL